MFCLLATLISISLELLSDALVNTVDVKDQGHIQI